MDGQCPGAPELKGPPRERDKKRERERKKKDNEELKKERKEKEEETRENETFQIPGRGPHPIYPHESK